MKKILLAASAVLLSATVAAIAGQPAPAPMPGVPGPGPERAVPAMDKNGDGAVDEAEFADFWAQKQKERFDRMDKNGDGKVTFEEFSAASGERAAEAFKRLDADGDGKLTPKDMEARRAARPHHSMMAPGEGRPMHPVAPLPGEPPVQE